MSRDHDMINFGLQVWVRSVERYTFQLNLNKHIIIKFSDHFKGH
jgi:hypothetical protein